MKLSSLAIVIALATTASAQTAPSPMPKSVSTPVQTQPTPAKASAKKSPAPAPKSTLPAPKTTTAKSSVPAKTPATAPKIATNSTPAPKQSVKATAAKSAKAQPTEKPSPKKVETKAEDKTPEVARTGRRDPFISPVRLAEERAKNNPACTTGARCLVISQVVLKGVVKTQNGMIAMVENAAKKEYNLHEKDSVHNGFVLKITTDSIVFQETVTDPLGRPVTKEVVKRVTAPAV